MSNENSLRAVFRGLKETESESEQECIVDAKQARAYAYRNEIAERYFMWKEFYMNLGAPEADAATIASTLLLDWLAKRPHMPGDEL